MNNPKPINPPIIFPGAYPKPHCKPLSPRESQIVACVARGMQNKEIAETLGLACGTVRVYMAKVFDKTGAANRTELARWALAQDEPILVHLQSHRFNLQPVAFCGLEGNVEARDLNSVNCLPCLRLALLECGSSLGLGLRAEPSVSDNSPN